MAKMAKMAKMSILISSSATQTLTHDMKNHEMKKTATSRTPIEATRMSSSPPTKTRTLNPKLPTLKLKTSGGLQTSYSSYLDVFFY
jgi:hypothetical protein